MKYNKPFDATDPDAPYVDESTGDSVLGSVPPAAAIEYPQREIVALISATGQTPANTDLTQLAKGVQSGKLNSATAGGTASALTGTLPIAPVGLSEPLSVSITPSFALNPGATFNLNGTGAKLITGADGQAIRSGDTIANVPIRLIYSAAMDKWVLTTQPRITSHAIAFQANTTNLTSLANATVTLSKFTNVVFDTNNAYSASTGLFTAPAAGIYQVNASFFFANVANPTLIYINKNGAVVAETSVNSYARVLTTSQVVSCVVGDTLSVTVAQQSGSSMTILPVATGHTFSAAYIGNI